MRFHVRYLFLALPFLACGTNEPVPAKMTNPLAIASTLPFQAPVFDKLKDSDHEPAIEAGMAKQLTEVEAITANAQPPSFENTIVAMELTGRDLTRASNIFFNLTGSATNDSLQAVKARLMPKLSAHNDAITLNAALFQRVKAVYEGRANAGLDPVQIRLVERYYTRFVRAGVALSRLLLGAAVVVGQGCRTLRPGHQGSLVIETASDLGQITSNMAGKIWQKIMMVQQQMVADAPATSIPAPHAETSQIGQPGLTPAALKSSQG